MSEYTWQQRWALGGARLRDDWRQFLRATVPKYAEVDDAYETLQALHKKKKISSHTLAIKGGELLVQMDELGSHVILPHDEDGVVRKGPPT
jgi:hypothetical protein